LECGAGDDVFKVVKTLIISITWLISEAMFAECPPPAGVYSSPGSLQRVSWIAGAPPTCKNDFLANWNKKENEHKASCTAIMNQMIAHAEKNVRRLHCDSSGTGNAYFRSKTVFGTVNHAFTDGAGNLQNSAMLDSCYVEQKMLDQRTGAKISFQNPVDHRRNQIRIGDRSGDNDAAGDFAVATVKAPIQDIDTALVPVISFDEMKAASNRGEPMELFMMSANAPAKETPNGCFGVTQCLNFGPNYPSEDKASALYVNSCPVIKGFSGSPLFALKKDKSGECVGFALVGIQRGGITFDTDGKPFHFDPDHSNDQSVKIGNNFGIAVGVDNIFRSWLAEVVSDNKRFEETSLQPQDLKPAGDNL
jgi:hypothetical protein